LGFGWIGWLIALAMRVFHINVSEIVGSIWNTLKSSLSGGKQVSSAHIDEVVSSAVEEHSKPLTEDDAEKAKEELDKQKTAHRILRDAKFLKLALIEFKRENANMAVWAAPRRMVASPGLLDMLMGRQSTTKTLLSKILGWVFKISFASAGLMVAGDVVNKMIGRPNAWDGSYQAGKPTQQSAQQPAFVAPTPKQTKFPVNRTYNDVKHNQGNDRWTESIPNEESSIENLLIMYAQEVYDGLDGKEAYIRNTPGLQAIKDRIVSYNRASQGDNIVYIPRYLTSKKQIVDMFIDDVAANVPEGPQKTQ
jgi:hypothetical protein